jgi:hypothetical protein
MTRSSQVQILPPLLRKAPETAPFAFADRSAFRMPRLSALDVPHVMDQPRFISVAQVLRRQ